MPAEQVPSQFAQSQFIIQIKTRLKTAQRKAVRDSFPEKLQQRPASFLLESLGRRPSRAPPNFSSRSTAPTKHANKRQAWNAAAASFPEARVVETDNNCWPMATAGDARSDDAEHAWMPVAVAKNDRRGFGQILVAILASAALTISRSRLCRSRFCPSNSAASAAASAASVVRRRRKAFSAVARRPAAFKRGRDGSHMCSAAIGRTDRRDVHQFAQAQQSPVRDFTRASDALRIRFSASRGTMSATVPSATRSSRRRRSKPGRGRVFEQSVAKFENDSNATKVAESGILDGLRVYDRNAVR